MLFNNYLNIGGFPEIAITENKELLKQYFNDIIEKDIIARHNVKDREVLEKMAFFLLSNSAKIISIAYLKKAYDISYQKAINYLKYFKESFIVFDVPKFSYSLKEQQKSQKKIYSLDTGLSNNVAFKFSEDKGRALENCVFLELKRKEGDIYYFKNNVGEVDFVIKKNNGSIDLIQVVWDLSEDNKNRELKGFKEALKEIKKIENLIILTNDQDGELKLDDRKIKIVPVYKWLLGF
jgi:predicted AAA+ superfamily ATPase